MSSLDTVGSLLAAIANLLAQGLRILSLADKSHWGPDEYEQVHALASALDEAKKDFQELAPLVNGQVYYETDRKHESLEELRALKTQFTSHIEQIKDWSRSGGPINPVWIRETQTLQRKLHRAQCRATRRIYTSEKESSSRCLGAFLVYRQQRKWAMDKTVPDELEYSRRYREELRLCNAIGSFKRFGDRDIAFVCDYCDGHIIWEDIENMPSIRTFQEAAASPILTLSPTPDNPHWQATGFTKSGHQEKQMVFAPVAIANHVAPQHRDWLAGLLCPYCETESTVPQEQYDDEDAYRPDLGYEDMDAYQEHLEWQHTVTAPTSQAQATSDNCIVM
ncbi:hypothetical protein NXS19_008825 [Fusarium pseudograminearum]|uniref:Uncharacterized protein n=1 Tax=Fusarium pseudograminearum (strain CS3096) TaxID=1028729 RepID=K3VZL9_FUSPC|nr:hypothetical protein FPSE_07267 [Fusarium pseudograminearum CS3096]EKJ72630.1 hypothetical protein FPSE_07267 [Fusarium pseudograminearum CS3096]KAF0636652.1 hypothetical protein FPSE5266_07267 [Fusarium pseudograminearum]UZP41009.1 hypothetical protein NXS19_008825 [Fusarium pseudograminearum]